jgi:hypothetical protein
VVVAVVLTTPLPLVAVPVVTTSPIVIPTGDNTIDNLNEKEKACQMNSNKKKIEHTGTN